MGLHENQPAPEQRRLPQDLRRAIRDFVVKRRVIELIAHGGKVASLAILATILCCAMDLWLSFSTASRWTLLSTLAGGFLFVLIWPMRRMLRSGADWIAAAIEIEKTHPQFDQRLTTLVSQFLEKSENRGSRDILDDLMEEIRELLPLARKVGYARVGAMLKPWALTGMIMAGAYFIQGTMGETGRILPLRLFLPSASYAPVDNGDIAINASPTTLARGEPLVIRAHSTKPGAMEIHINAGNGFVAAAMLPEGNDAYVYQTPMPDRDVTIYAKSGKTVSKTLVVKLAKPPRVRSRKAAMLVSAGAMQSIPIRDPSLMMVPIDARIRMELETDQPIGGAELSIPGRTIQFTPMDDPRKAVATWTCTESAGADLLIRGVDGQTARIPSFCVWKIKANENPVAEILDFPRSACYSPEDVVKIEYFASDDARMDKLYLQCVINENREIVLRLTPPNYGQNIRDQVVLPLASMDLKNGDVASLSIVAEDELGLKNPAASPVKILLAPNRVEPRELNLADRMQTTREIVRDISGILRQVRQWTEQHDPDPSTWLGITRLLGRAAERGPKLERELIAMSTFADAESRAAILNWIDRASVLSGELSSFNQWDLSNAMAPDELKSLSRAITEITALGDEIQRMNFGLRSQLALKCVANLNAVSPESGASAEIRLMAGFLVEPMNLPLDANASLAMEKNVEYAMELLETFNGAKPPDYTKAARQWAMDVRQRVPAEPLERRLSAFSEVERDPARARALGMIARAMARLSRAGDELTIADAEKIDAIPTLVERVLTGDSIRINEALKVLSAWRLDIEPDRGVGEIEAEDAGLHELDPDMVSAMGKARERLAEIPQRLLLLGALREKRGLIEERIREIEETVVESAVRARQLDQANASLKEVDEEMSESSSRVSPESLDELTLLLSPYEGRAEEGLRIVEEELRPALATLLPAARSSREEFDAAYVSAISAVDRGQKALITLPLGRRDVSDSFKPSDEQYEELIRLYFQLTRGAIPESGAMGRP